MTQEEIIAMAREAGCYEKYEVCYFVRKDLESFAALVAEPWIKTNKALVKEIIELHKQAEQEPVAWMNDSTPIGVFARHKEGAKSFGCTIPLYAAPVRTKDLTDDEIMKINVDTAGIVPTCDRHFHFARAVIAADRELNK